MEVNAGLAFDARIEGARWIRERGAFGEGEFYFFSGCLIRITAAVIAGVFATGAPNGPAGESVSQKTSWTYEMNMEDFNNTRLYKDS